jgi:proline iminopeptidase
MVVCRRVLKYPWTQLRLGDIMGINIKTGGVKLVQVDGKYNVWTKKVGNSSTKMLTLHGGPGLTHEGFECFEDFLPQAGIEFYYYDQLGSDYSDQPKDKSLWTVDRFREEVEQVRMTLGLESFYLYGHSWGGMPLKI